MPQIAAPVLTERETQALSAMAARLGTTSVELVERWIREHLEVDRQNVRRHGPAAVPTGGE